VLSIDHALDKGYNQRREKRLRQKAADKEEVGRSNFALAFCIAPTAFTDVR
jgi:hypothetical protein